RANSSSLTHSPFSQAATSMPSCSGCRLGKSNAEVTPWGPPSTLGRKLPVRDCAIRVASTSIAAVVSWKSANENRAPAASGFQAAAVEVDVAQRIIFSVDFDLGAVSGGPRLEPARFVVDAVAGEEPLGGETEDATIGRQAGSVEQAMVVE